jgi:hypothetical protein
MSRTTNYLETQIHILEWKIRRLERELHHLREQCGHNQPVTPTSIVFKEISMNLPDPGNTLVFTGTIQPTGAAFPSGTTFTVTSPDPNVSVSVDATGLVVTAIIAAIDVPGTVADITWTTSTFTPVPDGSPASLSVVIPLTIGAPPPPPTPTPTGVTFAQTS